ncbi:1-deoxy-D-xylulose-5-phosphate synthase [Helicobacter ailurogastricus]|uniref:1-deoxy-D-xylulose-5-phosphate synthase n=1 Tax=Helicobacter ailurogastricus TaxID=1578720 RepID=UPI00244D81DC|nr:1-deoxy-D-xylulose-5-phosphate synthase [Helicobacter ailurogastricus]GMB90906.1 1-deoxy-D-xylulose-5-phosphate synthase Dxs [Helicobacter ailurogastricus]
MQSVDLEVYQRDLPHLEQVCAQLRGRILEVVSAHGGHLSSSLGAIELIVGLHSVFDKDKHPFIFDTSHQAYAHKLLTGRFESFNSLRQMGGLSGFVRPSESPYDYFIAGHSSTALSVGVGVAKAYALKGKTEVPVVMIGDGSLSAGLAYEALDELGDRKYPLVILLNDNEMSIAKPIGAISNALSHLMARPLYQSLREKIKGVLKSMPEGVNYLANRFEESLKLITPGIFFEELGISYLGPIDGHDLEAITQALKLAKDTKTPLLIHAQTTKGKGYKMAEGKYEKWHGVGPFDLKTGQSLKGAPKVANPTQIYSDTLFELASLDDKIVGVTAAMPGGTGLGKLIDSYPERFWDVGIAEQHAVTSMAALAKEGFKPFVSIYSTFLQRAFDQIVHDVGIMSLPVKFAIDRAGIVGEDGETHQGLLDIAYLRPIPHMTLLAPRDNATLRQAIRFAKEHTAGPCAFRYPRGGFLLEEGVFESKPYVWGQCELLEPEGEILFVGYGNGVGRAHQTLKLVQAQGLKVALLDLCFLKPLDGALKEILPRYSKIYVFSDSYIMGGVASALLEFLEGSVRVESFEVGDCYPAHGNSSLVEQALQIDPVSLAQRVLG